MSNNNNNNNNHNKLTLYFVLVLGIIAVFIWSLIFIQIFYAVDSLTKQMKVTNQTQLILNSTRHEDESRLVQTDVILNQVKTIVQDHNKQTADYIVRDNNTTEKLIKQVENETRQNNQILKNQDTAIKQHNQVAKDHDILQNIAKNVTLENNELIKKYGPENLQTVKEIKEMLIFQLNSIDPNWKEEEAIGKNDYYNKKNNNNTSLD